ncbi:MAG: peptidoglycan editing factor PgeF [Legionella sp.]
MNIRTANWPAPKNISAVTTTRANGFSQAPYDGNNFGLHVGDNESDVIKNRQQLAECLHLPAQPIWLNQTHSTLCIDAEHDTNRDADAAVSRSASIPLVIMTADCLPIMLCDKHGTEIAAIHAGWRGLFNGIIENTLKKMTTAPKDILAWIGPAISQKHYEVGSEVYESFTGTYPQSIRAFETQGVKWRADLPKIAELILNNLGVNAVYQSNLCTFSLEKEFYSYRRQPQTGRIATLVWFNNQPIDS